jgi:hypothetical protein
MVLMKQLRMDTIPWISVDKAIIIIVITSNANIFHILPKSAQIVLNHCESPSVMIYLHYC